MPGRFRLRSVERCEQSAWSRLVWPRSGPGAPGVNRARVLPFLCGSWRCRRCSRWRGAVDWSRCAAGVLSRRWWLYCVLTLDPAGFRDPWDAYRTVGDLWDHRLRRSLRTAFGPFDYLQTWERHRSGWPHVNLVLSGPGLQQFCGLVPTKRAKVKRDVGGSRSCEYPPAFRSELRRLAVQAGFGSVLWVEILSGDRAESMAGYLVKLAQELTGAASKHGDQAPLMAPKRFRRIRASRGLLPARVAGAGELTGTILPNASWANLERRMDGAVDPPARTTKHRPAEHPVAWSAVDAAVDAQARRLVAAWVAGDSLPVHPVPPDRLPALRDQARAVRAARAAALQPPDPAPSVPASLYPAPSWGEIP